MKRRGIPINRFDLIQARLQYREDEIQFNINYINKKISKNILEDKVLVFIETNFDIEDELISYITNKLGFKAKKLRAGLISRLFRTHNYIYNIEISLDPLKG